MIVRLRTGGDEDGRHVLHDLAGLAVCAKRVELISRAIPFSTLSVMCMFAPSMRVAPVRNDEGKAMTHKRAGR